MRCAVNKYPLQLRDGAPYPVTEASCEIGDHKRLVILQRGDGLQRVGHIDPATGLGGPSYSRLIVEDAAVRELFFTRVLDYERRTRRAYRQSRAGRIRSARSTCRHWRCRPATELRAGGVVVRGRAARRYPGEGACQRFCASRAAGAVRRPAIGQSQDGNTVGA